MTLFHVSAQATTLSEFPAPISLVAITSLTGVFLTMIVQLIQDHKFQIGLPGINIRDLLTFSLLVSICSTKPSYSVVLVYTLSFFI